MDLLPEGMNGVSVLAYATLKNILALFEDLKLLIERKKS
jgi:hypothetical protein